MRCRACNMFIRVSYVIPRGCTEPVLEELCVFCKQPSPYENDWGKGDIIEEILHNIEEQDDSFGGLDEMDEEG